MEGRKEKFNVTPSTTVHVAYSLVLDGPKMHVDMYTLVVLAKSLSLRHHLKKQKQKKNNLHGDRVHVQSVFSTSQSIWATDKCISLCCIILGLVFVFLLFFPSVFLIIIISQKAVEINKQLPDIFYIGTAIFL